MKKIFSILFCFLLSNLCYTQVDLEKAAIEQLKLDPDKIAREFVIQKKIPNNPKETIIVIPEMVQEEKDYFELNTYILIVNNETGKIVNKYHDHPNLVSDAIILSKIEIDTAPYIVSENNRAFGIRVHYHNMSQPNPYSHSSLSLFIKSKDTLKEVLRTYEVMDYHAEWNLRCDGESVGHEKILIMTKKKTNGYYDILVKNQITETESLEDANGDCNASEKHSIEKTVLKYNGEEYTPNGTFRPLNVYLNDPDENATNIRKAPNGKIIQKLNGADDYFTLTITETNNGWFKVVNITGMESDDIKIPGGTAWIHGSVLEVSTRRTIKLLDAPDGEALLVGRVDQEKQVRIKDRYLDWVKIEYQGLSGWVESEWLCGNPVTTCP